MGRPIVSQESDIADIVKIASALRPDQVRRIADIARVMAQPITASRDPDSDVISEGFLAKFGDILVIHHLKPTARASLSRSARRVRSRFATSSVALGAYLATLLITHLRARAASRVAPPEALRYTCLYV